MKPALMTQMTKSTRAQGKRMAPYVWFEMLSFSEVATATVFPSLQISTEGSSNSLDPDLPVLPNADWNNRGREGLF